MLKKIAALSALICVLLSLSSCFGGPAKGMLDEQSKESFARIEDYLPKAELYFDVADTSVALRGVTDKKMCLDAFIDAAEPKEDLPAELVDGYVNSFSDYFSGDESASAGELETHARELIKREMVIYIAAAGFKCSSVSPDEAKVKANELAKLYGVSASDFYTEEAEESGKSDIGENYIVKSAILEERVRARLEEVWETLPKA